LLQNAGSETTRNLITTGTLALLEHPDQLEKLRSNLDLLPTAIEELLRYVTPVMYFSRQAKQDTEVGGTPIKEGERVVLSYGSARGRADYAGRCAFSEVTLSSRICLRCSSVKTFSSGR